MARFKCTRCDHPFDSEETRPMCPQGCRLDMSEAKRPNDFSTTRKVRTDEALAEQAAQAAREKKEAERRAKKERKESKPAAAAATQQPAKPQAPSAAPAKGAVVPEKY